MDFATFLEESLIIEAIDELSDDEMTDIAEDILNDEESLEEKLSILARKKRSNTMKRLSKKLSKAKERKLMTSPSKDDILKKARMSAVKIVKSKLMKGRTDLSPKEKERIEVKISKMGSKITKIAKKQIKTVRNREKERREQYKQNKGN